MLATIIPYFLLASISDKSAWPHGPEIKFDLNVEIRFKELKETNRETGFNITNEYTCRPKTDSSLQCQFQHKKVFVYVTNTETGEIVQSKEMSYSNAPIFESFPFGIGFDKKGVNYIIVNETASKNKPMIDIAKAMANALNVATDLSGVKLSADSLELEQVQNIALDKCKGKVLANLQPSFEGDNSKEADWNLELSPPLEKLDGRNLNMIKTWDLTNCNTFNTYPWIGMFVEELDYKDRSHEDGVTINLEKIDDKITVSRGSLDYQSVINLRIMAKNMSNPEERKLYIHQLSEIRLSGVQPAMDTWPEIENAVTISLNEQK